MASVEVTAPSAESSPPDTTTAPDSTSSSEPAVTSVTLSPDTVTAGEAAIGTVVLEAPAPAGGTDVSLMSNNTLVATVSPSATVAEGETSTTFTVASQPVASTDWAAISANSGGVTRQQSCGSYSRV